MKIEDIIVKVQYANSVIEEFRKTDTFDPFALLTGRQTKSQELLVASCEFLTDIENAIDKYKDNQKKCL